MKKGNILTWYPCHLQHDYSGTNTPILLPMGTISYCHVYSTVCTVTYTRHMHVYRPAIHTASNVTSNTFLRFKPVEAFGYVVQTVAWWLLKLHCVYMPSFLSSVSVIHAPAAEAQSCAFETAQQLVACARHKAAIWIQLAHSRTGVLQWR